MPSKQHNNRRNRSSTGSKADEVNASKKRYAQRMEHLATRQERYADRDFAIWAKDSWGSDDPDLGSRHSVRSASGGRPQSNRSRY